MLTFKVLIVEDDEAVAQAEAAKLRACGLEVKIVSRGDEAIPAMKDWRPHAVMLDLHLPGKSGPEIAQEMRMDSTLRQMIVISNSSHMDPKGSLGTQYYGQYILAKQEEPFMIDKLKPTRGLYNDLTAAVGILLGEKFQSTTQKMQNYIDKLQKEGKDSDRVGDELSEEENL